MSINPILIWFLAGLVLLLLEFAAPGVIIVFFGLGAWIAAVTTWLGLTDSLTSQLLTAGASSVVLLVVLRRWLRTRLTGHVSDDQDPARNIDGPAGALVAVTTDIAPGSDAGRVEFKGAAWRARSDEAIPAGGRAVVVETDGITLIVKPEQATRGRES